MKLHPLVALALTVSIASTAVAQTPASSEGGLFARNNLVAWCIVPYDAAERGPVERAQLLKELGIERMAWDWRDRHLEQLEEEVRALRAQDIELSAVWFWLDARASDALLPHHQHILETLERTGASTTLWVSFDDDFFAGLTDEERVAKGASTIGDIRRRASLSGSRVALYNHGDWFGEPENQIRIIEAIGAGDIGLVYNFHHAHDQLSRFPHLLEIMRPYLWTVNLNGMRTGGPKILDLGAGDQEAEMMSMLSASGFTGTIGILGHTEDEDVRDALVRNLTGMQRLLSELGEREALESYKALP